MTAQMIYSNKPEPPMKIITAQITRMMVESKPKNSAKRGGPTAVTRLSFTHSYAPLPNAAALRQGRGGPTAVTRLSFTHSYAPLPDVAALGQGRGGPTAVTRLSFTHSCAPLPDAASLAFSPERRRWRKPPGSRCGGGSADKTLPL